MAESKQDRELIELLNELRVALPGIQVMFAFLLVVPFSQGFTRVTSTQKSVYFLSFLFTTVAAACLIAPTSHHRLRWRERDKEQLLVTSNRLTIIGTAALALAMISVVYLITDYLYAASDVAPLVTAGAAAVFAYLWYGIPLIRALKEKS